MSGFETIAKHRIYLNQKYFLAYAGPPRDLCEKDKKEYQKIVSAPFQIYRTELKKLPFEKNPNVIPMTGMQLLEFIKDLKFIPLFDQYFEQSHLLQLTDAVIYESIKAKSYEQALNIDRKAKQ